MQFVGIFSTRTKHESYSILVGSFLLYILLLLVISKEGRHLFHTMASMNLETKHEIVELLELGLHEM